MPGFTPSRTRRASKREGICLPSSLCILSAFQLLTGDLAADYIRWRGHVGHHVGGRGQRALESEGQYLVHDVDEMQLHRVLDVVRQLAQVLLVPSRQDDL